MIMRCSSIDKRAQGRGSKGIIRSPKTCTCEGHTLVFFDAQRRLESHRPVVQDKISLRLTFGLRRSDEEAEHEGEEGAHDLFWIRTERGGERLDVVGLLLSSSKRE